MDVDSAYITQMQVIRVGAIRLRLNSTSLSLPQAFLFP